MHFKTTIVRVRVNLEPTKCRVWVNMALLSVGLGLMRNGLGERVIFVDSDLLFFVSVFVSVFVFFFAKGKNRV